MRYSEKIEKRMQQFYGSLSEKDKRRYAAVESLKLEHGGKAYICQLFGCHFETLKKGLEELAGEQLIQDRIRKKGGGRKNKIDTMPGLDAVFLEVLKENTATFANGRGGEVDKFKPF